MKIKIGTPKEWAEDYKKNIDEKVNNDYQEEDKTICYWDVKGSDLYEVKGTIKEIKKMNKLYKEKMEVTLKKFNLTKEQYKELQKAIKPKKKEKKLRSM